MNNTPQFEHDCDSCIFLGQYTHNGTPSDLYFCIGIFGGTVMARYSSDPPHYESYPLEVVEGKELLPHTSEARKRTKQRGLYTPNTP